MAEGRLRLHAIPFSTNVERVRLAAGHKGVELEIVMHDPSDRAAIRELSGQELTPVLEIGEVVVADSMAILARLEELHPGAPLWPLEGSARATAEVFCEWFNLVWKGPPNELAGIGSADPRAAELSARLRAWSDRFEHLLEGSDHLLGDDFGIADVVAFPFLRYAADDPDPGDDDPFHAVLASGLRDRERPRLTDWIERVGARPRG